MKLSGSGLLIHYLQLTVEFKNHDDQYIHEKTDLPDKLVLSVTGEELLNETAYRIGPVFNFHVTEINVESSRLVNEHRTKWPDEATHLQKHSFHSIPVNEVHYILANEERGRFWVYGNEESVFSFDYPAQCCCCFNCNDCCDNCACCNTSCPLFACFQGTTGTETTKSSNNTIVVTQQPTAPPVEEFKF